MIQKLALVAICAALCISCGEKADQPRKSAEAARRPAQSGEGAADMAAEGERIYMQRVAAGDTIAMPYGELQAFLPDSIEGYRREGPPSGTQQTMPDYAISSVTQRWVGQTDEEARITVQIADWGGTRNGYGMASLGLVAIDMEDEKQKVASLTFDVPMTSGVMIFSKQDKSGSVTAGTRYRYMIVASSAGAKEDPTAALTELVTGIARKFEGK